MGFTNLNISSLVKADWNYKEENSELSERLLANFEKNGQIENIIVRELGNGLYEVINGNHRLDVMRDLNYTDVQVYNLGAISDTEAYQIAIETNETKFYANPLKLSTLLKDIAERVSLEELIKTMPIPKQLLETHINVGSKISEFIPPILKEPSRKAVPESSKDVEIKEDDPLFEEVEVTDSVHLHLRLTPETYDLWERLKASLPELTEEVLFSEIVKSYLISI